MPHKQIIVSVDFKELQHISMNAEFHKICNGKK